MASPDPLVDNSTSDLEETYRKIIRESEEVRIATGYFYLSGFDLYSDDLETLGEPDELDRAPFRILMGHETDRRTADEIEEGQNLRDRLKDSLTRDIEELNNAQLDRLDRLRDFIANGLVAIRVRKPEEGYFHAKGAAFRKPSEEDGRSEDEDAQRPVTTIVGSSNFSQSGHRNNIELNLTSDDPERGEAFEAWYDNQWANAEEFSEEIVDIIENHDRYQEWKEDQRDGGDEELGTYIEPFELYKLLSYDALGGSVSERDSPLYYFQTIGYESAREKLAKYGGCIISDSVGLGKTFIGGELLYDYRNQNQKCLLIVPANLTGQWADILQDQTDEDGNPFFGLDVDGEHLRVMSISKFQNLPYEEVTSLRDQFDVILIDEAHRFRNFGKWRPDPSHDDDYKGTRRHANLRQLRGKTMVMLTATPINNSATDLKNLISLFTDENEIRNKANLDFGAFDDYIDLSEKRKRVAADKEEMSEAERQQLLKRLQNRSGEISDILNEVMVLRTRKHVKEKIQDDEDFEMSFKPPEVHKEQYSLPPAYRPVYDSLPDVMDALHLPHITIRNPEAGSTLKALYKLNLLKRLESSTYAFVQSIETLHRSESQLLGLLEGIPEDTDVDTLRAMGDEDHPESLDDFVEGADAAEDLEQTLEEFGFDSGALRADGEGESTEKELADATVGEVRTYIREDLALVAHFLSMFIGDVAEHDDDIRDHSVTTRQWLSERGANGIPDVPEDELNPVLYPHSDLSDVDEATREFYESVFTLRSFRDPKIDEMAEVLHEHDQKVLVFTQYRATADYVYRSLRDDPNSPLTAGNSAVVKGGDEDKQEIIKRFAPEAAGYQETLAESGESELQYVVATDTLSEGVNLQDINVVVNYDLPWNPMRIVQRVGRIDRIGSTADKHVHNFFPDGDIEAAIKLLKRLQAKINDIALIVGKENNILDPNEDELLERAGVETEKTIGELEIEEIESTIRESREVEDYNDLDDTSKNPLLRNAGSNEDEALERYHLKRELNQTYGLGSDDFEFAEDYFDTPPAEREMLYTNAVGHEKGPRSGVFGLAHLWFGDGEDAPLGRTRRAFYYRPFGDEVKERPVRMLQFPPELDGEQLGADAEQVLEVREEIEAHLDDRLERIREGQVEAAFEQGEDYSMEQETLISYLQHLETKSGDKPLNDPTDEHDTIGERAADLRERLKSVKLKHTDEDELLRERFRHNDEYDAIGEWPVEKLFDELDEFLSEKIEAGLEYQSTLAGESEVKARLLCWGVISRG